MSLRQWKWYFFMGFLVLVYIFQLVRVTQIDVYSVVSSFIYQSTYYGLIRNWFQSEQSQDSLFVIIVVFSFLES